MLPHGTSGITPDQVPANLFKGTGVEVDLVVDVCVARFVFVSAVRFGFGFADCSVAGVGFSSTIGAGDWLTQTKIASVATKRCRAVMAR